MPEHKPNSSLSWLRQLAQKNKSKTTLEDAVLFGDYRAYFTHRLRGFATLQTISLMVHIVGTLFLYKLYTKKHFIGVVVASNLTVVLGAFYWGGLEIVREKIRHLYQLGRKSEIARTIEAWITLSILLSIIFLFVSLAWIVFRVWIGNEAFNIYHAFWLAITLKFSLSIIIRTIYSGVLAMRRSYRPIAYLIMVETLTFGMTLLLWPWFKFWSFSLSVASVSVALFATGLMYHRRALDSIHLPRLSVRWKKIYLLPGDLLSWKRFILAGTSVALQRMGSILVLAALFPIIKSGYNSPSNALIIFHLMAPVLSALSSWTQLFYFDFKKLGQGSSISLLSQLYVKSRRLSVWLALIGWILCVSISFIVKTPLGIAPAIVLLFFCVVRSRLSIVQLWEFAANRNLRLILASLAIGIVAFSIRPLNLAHTEMKVLSLALPPLKTIFSTSALVLSFALGFWILRMAERNVDSLQFNKDDWNSPPQELSPYLWITYALKNPNKPVLLGKMRLQKGCGKGARSHASQTLHHFLPPSAKFCFLNPNLIVWSQFESADSEAFNSWSSIQIASRMGGKIEELLQNKIDALTPTVLIDFLSSESFTDLKSIDKAPTDLEIEKAFRNDFPSGFLLAPGRPHLQARNCLTREERKAVWREGRNQAEGRLFVSNSKSRFEAYGLCKQDSIQFIFVVERKVSPEIRKKWRDQISRWNLQRIVEATSSSTLS